MSDAFEKLNILIPAKKGKQNIPMDDKVWTLIRNYSSENNISGEDLEVFLSFADMLKEY